MNNLDRSLSDIIGSNNYGPKRGNRSGRRSTPYSSNGDGTRVYIGNLPYSASWQEVKEMCKEYGFIKKVFISEKDNGDSKGYAVAIFGNAEDAQACIEGMEGQELDGRKLHCKLDSKAGRQNSRNYSKNSNGNKFMNMNNPMARNMMKMMGTMMGTMMGNMMGQDNKSNWKNMKQNHVSGGNTSVYVGNLPWSVRWPELKNLCKEYGYVIRADVAEDNGKSKGYGVVVFKSKRDALNCVRELDGYELDGRVLNCHLDKKGGTQASKRYSNDGNSTSVYVGNLPFSTKWQDLKDMCQSFGDVNHVSIQENEDGRSKGFAVVRFGSESAAQDCIDNLNGQDFEGRELNVRMDKFNGSGGGGKSVYVGNLPYSAGWKELKDLCKNYGDVVRADVEEHYDGRSKGFGIVTFSNADEARNCISNLNNEDFDGRELNVRFDRET